MAAAATSGTAPAQPAVSEAQPPAETGGDPLALDDLPGLGVDWPDLETPAEPLPPLLPDAADGVNVEPFPEDDTQLATPDGEAPADAAASSADADALAAIDPGASLRYHVELEGLGDAADATLLTRFDTLSALKQADGDRANIAQIRRRGQSDTDLLDELLRARGYYDSRARLRLRADNGGDPRVNVILGANPGKRYLLDAVNVDGLEGTTPLGKDLRALFPIAAGDPADTDAILGATNKLRVDLSEGGYPFANVREPVLTVDHQQREAILSLNVDTGSFRRFGEIKVNAEAPFDAKHVAVISRFDPGEPYNQSDIADLNSALIATGLVSQVSITPEEGKDDQTVDIVVNMASAPPRTVAGEIGYGTGEGFRIEASWQHRNFFPPEGALTVRGVLGTQEQSLIATLRRSNLGKRDQVLNVEVGAANIDQPAYRALTAGVAANIERQTSLIFQKNWIWSAGTELRISDERDLYGETLTPRRRTFIIAALPANLTYDGSDDLLDPSKGFRLGGRLSPELSLQDGAFGYVRAQVDGSVYIPFNDRVTIAGRARLGTIIGAQSDRIAPTRRYYAGGGGSVRGYSYQAIGPRDANNDPVGGRSLGEISLEARFRFGSLNQFGIVPFIDAGTISPNMLPTLSELRVGAGLGFRYYSNFGPIRVDVGTPINPQPGDSRIGVYVSLGQAF